MPRPTRRGMTDEYMKLRSQAFKIDGCNDCSVMAVATVTGRAYADAYAALAVQGRQMSSGAYVRQITGAVEALGMKCLPCKPVDIINLYPSPHRKLKGVTTHHPDRFRKHWPQGRYLLVTASHVAAVVDGEMHDWARNNSIRVTSIYKVLP